MAVTVGLYGLLLKSLTQGKVDFTNDVFKAMLCTSAYVYNQNTHQFKSAVNNEIVGSGYTPGGVVVEGVDVSYSSKILTITASNLAWPVATFTGARQLIVYDDSWETEATKPLVCCINFGANVNSTSQSFYYNWPGGVMCQLAVP